MGQMYLQLPHFKTVNWLELVNKYQKKDERNGKEVKPTKKYREEDPLKKNDKK
jgi:hypothetical protein